MEAAAKGGTPGEGEWLLDVQVQLFDHDFVGPAEAKKKRDALNAKVADAKKSPLRKPLAVPMPFALLTMD